MQRYDEAEKIYRKAINLDPDYAISYLNLRDLLAVIQRLDESEEMHRKAIEISDKQIALLDGT
jgi:tetratricopeptide (TPR) repeat protein